MKQYMAHHAIVFEGDRTATLEEAKKYITVTLEIPLESNPDVSIHTIEKYGVNDARALKMRASQTPLGHAQVFLLALDNITIQAQNALLKLLEEPADKTYFVLVVPTIHILLPTIRSRITYGKRLTGTPTQSIQAQEFLSAVPKDRIKIIANLVENKDRVQARDLLDAIEAVLHKEGVRDHAEALDELAFIRRYLADNSSSLKMLLEHLAVTI